MRQILVRIWAALTAILALIIIIRIIKRILWKLWILWWKISHSFKEKIKKSQIKKDLKEKKESIINPNTEDSNTNEEFQEVIESAIAEKSEEESDNKS